MAREIWPTWIEPQDAAGAERLARAKRRAPVLMAVLALPWVLILAGGSSWLFSEGARPGNVVLLVLTLGGYLAFLALLVVNALSMAQASRRFLANPRMRLRSAVAMFFRPSGAAFEVAGRGPEALLAQRLRDDEGQSEAEARATVSRWLSDAAVQRDLASVRRRMGRTIWIAVPGALVAAVAVQALPAQGVLRLGFVLFLVGIPGLLWLAVTLGLRGWLTTWDAVDRLARALEKRAGRPTHASKKAVKRRAR